MKLESEEIFPDLDRGTLNRAIFTRLNNVFRDHLPWNPRIKWELLSAAFGEQYFDQPEEFEEFEKKTSTARKLHLDERSLKSATTLIHMQSIKSPKARSNQMLILI